MELRANHTVGLLDTIKDYLNSDKRFFYHGRGANEGEWRTYEKREDGWSPIDLSKNIAQKGNAEVLIRIYKEDEEGVEFKIEMRFPSYFEWDTVFEGFVNTYEEFTLILKCVGILE